MKEIDVIIIGAGVSGLVAAVNLQKKGRKVIILEATERVGGRIKTDLIQGFLLDRGFQVLLTAYPETKGVLKYDLLDLKPFIPGAIIHDNDRSFKLIDPIRKPLSVFSMLFSPVGTLKDKLKMLSLRLSLRSKSPTQLFKQEQITTLEALKKYGFSDRIIENFFRPFLGGIFLEKELVTSRRMFDFVFKMFSDGATAVPALGMEMIPKQLESRLKKNTIRFQSRVKSIEDGQVILNNQQILKGKKILLTIENLDNDVKSGSTKPKPSTTCIYYAARESPVKKPIITLNASSRVKWVNNLCVITDVAPSYAANGQALIAVSLVNLPVEDRPGIEKKVKLELTKWYGKQVEEWRHIKTYHIDQALPNQNEVIHDMKPSSMKISENLYQCGDFILNGSINAAMKTGRVAAELIDQDLK